MQTTQSNQSIDSIQFLSRYNVFYRSRTNIQKNYMESKRTQIATVIFGGGGKEQSWKNHAT